MITAVDSCVLFDLLLADPVFGPASAKAFREALEVGQVIACEAVWAEVSSHFSSLENAKLVLSSLGVRFEPGSVETALRAGRCWREHREYGGTKRRVVADFLVGAHACETADRLLTRDSGFYRDCFSGLVVLDPSR